MVRRREQLLSIMATEVCQATEEVLTIVNTSWEPADCREMRDRLAAGVRFRTIFDRDSLEHGPHLEWEAALAGEPGFEVRVVERVETLYLLVDRRVVLLNLSVPGTGSPGSHAESLLIRHEGLGVFSGLPSPLEATRYHSLVIEPSSMQKATHRDESA